MIDGFRGKPTEGYFAIYDGHGGRQAVDHVQRHFHNVQILCKSDTKIEF